MESIIEVEGDRWVVRALPEEVDRSEDDRLRLVRVRFELRGGGSDLPSREGWLRLEEDVPARDVLDQYGHDELVEAFLVAEEMPEG